MMQRPFGDQGFDVSVLGFGAGHIGGPDFSEDDASGLLTAALDAGVTFLDTARGYALSEQRIGAFLGSRRADVVLSTKVGYDIDGTEDWSAEAVTGGVERALSQLRTDWVDIVFLHSCTLDVLQSGAAIEALQSAHRAGKVRVVGYSGENEALAWAVSSGHFGAVQTSVNLADQWSLHHVLADAEARGLGVVAKRPLANAPWRYPERPLGNYAELYWDRLKQLALEPEDGGWAEVALRFTAYSPGVSTAIVGTGSAQHLAEAVEAVAAGPLDDAEYARWRAAFLPYADLWPGSV